MKITKSLPTDHFIIILSNFLSFFLHEHFIACVLKMYFQLFVAFSTLPGESGEPLTSSTAASNHINVTGTS